MKKIVTAMVLAKLVFLSAFAFTACQTAQLSPLDASVNKTPTPAAGRENDNINRPVSEPYTGDLSIFEDENRAQNLQIERVMDILKISEGKTVADLGAGSGWFTTRAANRVGAKGKVFAVEINQEYINYINDRAKKSNLGNIQTVFGTEDDPKLADASVDAVLILKTYHEIGQPIKVLRRLKKSLKKDGLIGIIDKNGTGDDHGIDKAQVVEEAKRAGFTLKEEYDFTKPDGMDYFLVFWATK